ncbi:MAG: zinc ribbon domain-containing protein [Spartobacteria bacterium]|nr:zinc ribbon domain-containing protein [Spartobacteria bacterium]
MIIDDRKRFGIRECPSCACEVPANNNHCPICGYAFPHPSPARRAMKIWGALLMLGLLLWLLLGGC